MRYPKKSICGGEDSLYDEAVWMWSAEKPPRGVMEDPFISTLVLVWYII